MAKRFAPNDDEEKDSTLLDYFKFAIPCFICAAVGYAVLYYFGLI